MVGSEDAQMENARLADSLSLAFLVLLEALTPTERAVFILREVLAYEFSEIAPIVEKSEANCRQILVRARKHVAERRPRFEVTLADAEDLMSRFDQAVKNGEIEKLLACLADHVVLFSDGGGKARALRRPIHGADPVARVLIGAARKFGSATAKNFLAFVNGSPGLVTFENERAVRVMALTVEAGGHISQIFVITNPDKLRHLSRPD